MQDRIRKAQESEGVVFRKHGGEVVVEYKAQTAAGLLLLALALVPAWLVVDTLRDGEGYFALVLALPITLLLGGMGILMLMGAKSGSITKDTVTVDYGLPKFIRKDLVLPVASIQSLAIEPFHTRRATLYVLKATTATKDEPVSIDTFQEKYHAEQFRRFVEEARAGELG